MKYAPYWQTPLMHKKAMAHNVQGCLPLKQPVTYKPPGLGLPAKVCGETPRLPSSPCGSCVSPLGVLAPPVASLPHGALVGSGWLSSIGAGAA